MRGGGLHYESVTEIDEFIQTNLGKEYKLCN